MRKTYFKPMVEIEAYTLEESIAANCGSVVKLGPGDNSGYVCSEFGKDPWEVQSILVGFAAPTPSFYSGGSDGPACDCYYSAGGEGYFTS